MTRTVASALWGEISATGTPVRAVVRVAAGGAAAAAPRTDDDIRATEMEGAGEKGDANGIRIDEIQQLRALPGP